MYFYKFRLTYYDDYADKEYPVYGLIPANSYAEAMEALSKRFNNDIEEIYLAPFAWGDEYIELSEEMFNQLDHYEEYVDGTYTKEETEGNAVDESSDWL